VRFLLGAIDDSAIQVKDVIDDMTDDQCLVVVECDDAYVITSGTRSDPKLHEMLGLSPNTARQLQTAPPSGHRWVAVRAFNRAAICCFSVTPMQSGGSA
jgi:hypothetical protein